MERNYKGLIWTNHALERLRERGIKQGDAWATFQRPEQTRPAQKKGNWVYYRTWDVVRPDGSKGKDRIEVVAAQNEKKEWIVLSVWSKPIYGEFSNKKSGSKKNEGVWMKILRKIFH